MNGFIARFRRVSDGATQDQPLPLSVQSVEEAWALARVAAAGHSVEVEVVDVFPVNVQVIEVEMPPVPEVGDTYWPSIPDGLLHQISTVYFMLMLHRYHH